MKTLFLKLALLFLVLISTAKAEENHEATQSHFSVRIRPVALVFGIPGAEIYGQTDSGNYLGLTGHFFSGENIDKQTTLLTREFGLKFGKIFGSEYVPLAGWWVQGAIFLNRTTVSSFYAPTLQRLTGNFYQLSYAATVGYQFRMTFVNPDRLNVRLGAGIAYKSQSVLYLVAADQTSQPIGVRRRLDPIIEFTLGYLL